MCVNWWAMPDHSSGGARIDPGRSGHVYRSNVVHASDSNQRRFKEIGLFFEEEIHGYQLEAEPWVYGNWRKDSSPSP